METRPQLKDRVQCHPRACHLPLATWQTGPRSQIQTTNSKDSYSHGLCTDDFEDYRRTCPAVVLFLQADSSARSPSALAVGRRGAMQSMGQGVQPSPANARVAPAAQVSTGGATKQAPAGRQTGAEG